MKSYLKFLSRNKLFTVIEVIGISIALAFAIPLLSFISDKWKVDHGKDFRKIYAVSPIGNFETTFGLADYLRYSIPEVNGLCRFFKADDYGVIEIGDSYIDASCAAADTSLLTMFHARLLNGTADELGDRQSAFISERFSRNLSGNILGKTFSYKGEEYIIRGVFRNFRNHLIPDIDILFSTEAPFLDNLRQNASFWWEELPTFISSDVGRKELEPLIKEACQRYYKDYYGEHPEQVKDIKLIRYDQISSNINNTSLTRTWGISLWAIEILCLIVLAFAVLNYINLNVALSTKRGKEMATRRLMGYSKRDVIGRFFKESLFLTILCFFIGYALSFLIAPVVNQFFLQTGTSVQLTPRLTAGSLIVYILAVLIISVIDAVVPATIMSRYSPLDVVKGDFRTENKKGTGSVLIGIQCFLTVIITAAAILLFIQYKSMAGRSLGCDAENTYIIKGSYTKGEFSRAVNTIRELPFVEHAGLANDSPGDGTWSVQNLKLDGGYRLNLNILRCDGDAFEAMGFIADASAMSDEVLWTTPAMVDLLASHGIDEGELARLLSVTYAGRINDYAVSLDSDRAGAVIVTNHTDFNRLIIKLRSKDKSSIASLMDVFRKTVGDYSGTTQYGFMDELAYEKLKPTRAIFGIVMLFALLLIALSILGLVAMSTYYVSVREHDIAIYKVFGATVNDETWRNLSRYLKIMAWANIVGIPAAVFINSLILQSYSYKISGTFWIYLLTFLFTMAISFVAVFVQIRTASMVNPADVLKKE